ncbi:MAG: energy transducer TonB [Pseudomonadota bacterium]
MAVFLVVMMIAGLAVSTVQASENDPSDFIRFDTVKGYDVASGVRCPNHLRVRKKESRVAFKGDHQRLAEKRCRPSPPVECVLEMNDREVFDLEFLVGADGRPEFIALKGSSQECADKYVAASIAMSRFAEASKEEVLKERVTINTSDKQRVIYDPPLPIAVKPRESCSWKAKESSESLAALAGDGPMPVHRCLIKYPEACMYGASVKAVAVVFNIDPDGATSNVRIKASSDPCINRSAARSVATWRYEPSRHGQVDADTVFTYTLEP